MRRGAGRGDCQGGVIHRQQLPWAAVGGLKRSPGKLCMTARGALDDVRGGAYEWRIPGDVMRRNRLGRLAQRESTRFTRVGSLVQSQYRPPFS